ncbi:Multidrug resistance protein MdtG [Arthrobacter sp. SO5]|uniref:MFS transporter n=1 Tax=Arthrobacter sp. SO5 TaxID=1897055 RepID=UPI001E48500D|nr:MFS transporter [Arthrobacter sp. SO5]MCB5273725.1 Multidrug resistance protein MdtG [Arthrobacter sp. SO5]
MTVAVQHDSYWQVLRTKRLAAFLTGDTVAKIGDGMAFIALPILVLQIHGDFSAALAISLVFAIPFLIPTGISLFYGLSRYRYIPKTVVLADTAFRSALLTLAAVLAWTEQLTVWSLIALLTVSSFLRLLSSSGQRLLALGLVEKQGQYSVNGILGTTDSMGLFIIGPAVGGMLAATAGPAFVLAVNGGTSFLLLLTTLFSIPAARGPVQKSRRESPSSGLQILTRNPAAVRLFLLIFFFNLFYGPVEVALPLFITGDLAEPATALGLVWTCFGIGAFIGAFAVNFLRKAPQLAVITAIVAGWALCVIGLGLATTVTGTCAAFFFGGLVFGPFTALVYSMLQSFLQDHEQQPAFTLWAAGLTLASPLGLGIAGPLISTASPRTTFFICAAITAALIPLFLIRPRKTTDTRTKNPPPPNPAISVDSAPSATPDAAARTLTGLGDAHSTPPGPERRGLRTFRADDFGK